MDKIRRRALVDNPMALKSFADLVEHKTYITYIYIFKTALMVAAASGRRPTGFAVLAKRPTEALAKAWKTGGRQRNYSGQQELLPWHDD